MKTASPKEPNEPKSVKISEARQAKRDLERDIQRMLFEFTLNYGVEVLEINSRPIIEYGVILPRDYQVRISAVTPFEGKIL
jgi:hypothetical protein